MSNMDCWPESLSRIAWRRNATSSALRLMSLILLNATDEFGRQFSKTSSGTTHMASAGRASSLLTFSTCSMYRRDTAKALSCLSALRDASESICPSTA
jgi:hypothetical protein